MCTTSSHYLQSHVILRKLKELDIVKLPYVASKKLANLVATPLMESPSHAGKSYNTVRSKQGSFTVTCDL